MLFYWQNGGARGKQMTTIANNLRIAFSSEILQDNSQNQTFDLTRLFLNEALTNGLFIQFDSFVTNLSLPSEFTSLFEFTTLPSEDDETFELTVLDDLSSQKGNKFTVTLWAVEPQENNTNAILEEYQLEIEILDNSANTVDAITVREN